MPKTVDLTGQRFGRLVALSICGRKGRKAVWSCRCDCGKSCEIFGYNLANGHTKSCGCLRSELSRTTKRIHGMRSSKLYSVYHAMIARCYSGRAASYPYYGARGIRVCEEWLNSPSAFFAWAMTNGYREGEYLDRIDNDGYYSPQNCRWVDAVTQANNKSNNRIITFNGCSMSLTAWSRRVGLTESALRRRITVYGWTIERALTTPPKGARICTA